MANVFSPFGFTDVTVLVGQTSSYGQSTAFIQQSNTTPVFQGDPVVRLANGYVSQATTGATQIHGISVGVQYISTSQGRTLFQDAYLGADAKTDININLVSFNDAVFLVQSGNGGPVPWSAIGQNIGFQIGTGNVANQQSGAFVDFATIAAPGSSLPFRILGLYTGLASFSPSTAGFTGVAGVNGSDPTTPFNYVYVGFNNQDFRVTTGI